MSDGPRHSTGLLWPLRSLAWRLVFLGIDPIKALYYSAVLNGLAAPPLMALIILIANNKKIMGKFVNKRISNIVGWIIVLVMSIAGILLIIDMLKELL